MITGKNVSKQFADKVLLEDINFKIGNGAKVGLVGRNGCGKSTLFKMILGIEELTKGSIDTYGEVIGYIPQEFSFPKDMLVGEYLESKLEYAWDFYKVEALADKVNFTNFDPYQSLSTLSEGQKMKVKLIETFLLEPTVLFIDEPTNHLDIEGIEWFEEYIKGLSQTVIMISHDRSFLNNTVDEIWEIDKQQVFRFVGNYDTYREEKLKLISKWDDEYKKFLQHKAKLERLLENVRKIKDGKKRGSAVESAKKRIEREVEANKKEKYTTKHVQKMEFDTDVHYGKLMIKFDGVSMSYGKKDVFSDMDFEIRGKEKVWLFGPNGAGKSTMVKLVMQEIAPTKGEITLGNNIRVGYFSQVQVGLQNDNDLLKEFMAQTGCEYGKCFAYLKRFLFEKDALTKRVWQLSPGERARFAFSIFAANDYDLLILDEPDNHLDIDTKEVLEKSLSEYEGTLLLVSHDRYFVESVGIDRVLNLRDGKLDLFSTS